ncbi:hypothetical protein BpHYR1_054620 [Brachionus plicatilis]|uniref:Uncharacterized protein n=1 Tax=Brachionus plicatilis TaxID=10195 RepID=A0A3M7QZJ2_BRAPC|nr:hypothetical protein BpHYR1_054620 [Brachionus plicatilis]
MHMAAVINIDHLLAYCLSFGFPKDWVMSKNDPLLATAEHKTSKKTESLCHIDQPETPVDRCPYHTPFFDFYQSKFKIKNSEKKYSKTTNLTLERAKSTYGLKLIARLVKIKLYYSLRHSNPLKINQDWIGLIIEYICFERSGFTKYIVYLIRDR